MSGLLPERERVLELLVEERAVRKPGERVVQGELPQLLLRLPLRGDVEEVALQVERRPVVVEDDDSLVADPDRPAVLGDQAVLDAQRLVRRVRVRVRCEHPLAVVGMERADEEIGVVRPLGGRVAEHRLDLLAGEDVRARRVERVDVDDQGKLLDQGAIAPRVIRAEDGCRRRLRLTASRSGLRRPVPRWWSSAGGRSAPPSGSGEWSAPE